MKYYDDVEQRNYNNSNKSRKSKKKNDLMFSDFIARGSFNSYLFFLIIGLAIIGLIMILSSSYYNAIQKFGTGFFYFKKQLIIFVLGLVLMLITSKINYNVYKKLAAPILYWSSIGLLAYVLFKQMVIKGAARWIEIFGFSFQPSELAKIGMILFLAVMLSRRKDISEYKPKERLSPWRKFTYSISIYKREIGYILLPTILIGIENWSTSIVVLLTGIAMLAMSGLRVEKLFFGCLIFLGCLILFIKVGGITAVENLNIADGKYNNRLERLNVWLDPFADPLNIGYQTVQSLYAIGSGGITGVGLGKSKQKLGYLPESYNDMIFTIICEEFGLIGAVVIIGLFIALIVQCTKVALNAPDKFSMFFTVGMVSLISLQVLVNVGVVTGTLPNTGMPLPFISYGGTALLMLMIGMGVVLSISRYEDE